jgi:hypothetical protein
MLPKNNIEPVGDDSLKHQHHEEDFVLLLLIQKKYQEKDTRGKLRVRYYNKLKIRNSCRRFPSALKQSNFLTLVAIALFSSVSRREKLYFIDDSIYKGIQTVEVIQRLYSGIF